MNKVNKVNAYEYFFNGAQVARRKTLSLVDNFLIEYHPKNGYVWITNSMDRIKNTMGNCSDGQLVSNYVINFLKETHLDAYRSRVPDPLLYSYAQISMNLSLFLLNSVAVRALSHNVNKKRIMGLKTAIAEARRLVYYLHRGGEYFSLMKEFSYKHIFLSAIFDLFNVLGNLHLELSLAKIYSVNEVKFKTDFRKSLRELFENILLTDFFFGADKIKELFFDIGSKISANSLKYDLFEIRRFLLLHPNADGRFNQRMAATFYSIEKNIAAEYLEKIVNMLLPES